MRQILIVLSMVLLTAPAWAQTIPTTLGWYAIPNTTIRSVCASAATYPSIQGVEGCAAVTADWAGGTLDNTSNRLLIHGGGHSGYAGNEVYALNLNDGTSAPTIQRLNEPTASVRDGCTNSGTYADGKPVARHTYNHLVYLPRQHAMFLWGGSQWQCGNMAGDTWMLNLATMTWTAKSNTNGPSANFGRACALAPWQGLVYCRDDFSLRSFDPDANTWTNRSASNGSNEYKSGVIDTRLRRYYYNTVDSSTTLFYYDISNAFSTGLTRNSVTPSGCTWLNNGQVGWEYDPVQDRHVIWNGGNSVQLYNTTTNSCSTVTFTGGPTAMANGTYGRFRYVPKLNLFVVCNSVDANCYSLRLTAPLSASDANFQDRCQSVGVLTCVDFNQSGDFLTSNYTPGVPGIVAGTSTTAARDTTVYASGGGAAKFVIASGGGAGSAGWYATPMNKNHLAGSTFYVQFRQRFDTAMLTNGTGFGGGGWKQVIFHNNTANTCAQLEITTNNQGYRGFPIMYTACGAGLTEYDAGGGNIILEYSQPYPPGSSGTVGVDYYCRYQLLPATTRCAAFQANQWMTFYYQITIGTFGSANSTLKGYVGFEGDTALKLFINKTNMTLNQDSAGLGFNFVTLLPYDTGKDGRAHPAATTWYDELIVSTNPIAVPGAVGSLPDTTAPAAPTGISISSLVP